MVLPIPVRPGSGENALRFINLKDYPDFFTDLDRGFPSNVPASGSIMLSKDKGTRSAPLPVVDVGNFEASFVPTPADFPRLDARFRLPPGTWEKLPEYKSFGFAVFKLKPGRQHVHPMAFSFPSTAPAQLFFPTVHIHDGKVHSTAKFDHFLYCQRGANDRFSLTEWQESMTPANQFMSMSFTAGLVAGENHCYRKSLRGNLPNRDTILS